MRANLHPLPAGPETVFGGLAATGLAPLRRLELGDGMALTLWRRVTPGLEIAYARPGHHTLACYLRSGDGTRRIDARGAAPLAEGDICSLPEDHSSRWLVRGELCFLHLYFKPEHIARRAVLELDCDARLVQLEDRRYAAAPGQPALCGELAALPWDGPDAALRANELAHEALSGLLRMQGRSLRHAVLRGGLAVPVRRRVADFIESHLGDALTLGVLANLACLSEFHFLRQFRTSFGVPPHAWIAARRVDRARSLLRHSALPLQRIADDCGYADLSHFSHRFRAAADCSPSAFRRAMQA
jgi:AraC family transcriptional regulator